MNGGQVRLVPCGDSAALVELGAGISPATGARVLALWDALQAEALPGVGEVVPAYRTLLIYYDPERLGFAELAAAVAHLAAALPPAPALVRRLVVLPTVYGGAAGPDLDDVAAHANCSPDDVIRRHSGRDYLCYCVGFAPGFPYLGGLDPGLATPRLATPRTRVPAGSVGIAGDQTGVYPRATPGGWRLIGRTPVALFDPAQDRPALLAAGDAVRFVPVDGDTAAAVAAAVARGEYRPEVLPPAAARLEAGGPDV